MLTSGSINDRLEARWGPAQGEHRMSTKSKISAPGGSEVATTLTSEGTSSSHPVNAVSETGAKLDSRLAILQEISLALNSTLDPEKLIDLILDASIRYTGATTGSLILITEDNHLQIVAARGLGSNVTEEVKLKVGEGITGWVALHGKPLNV